MKGGMSDHPQYKAFRPRPWLRHKEEGVWIATDLELCFYAQYWLQSSGIVAQLLERGAPVLQNPPGNDHISPYYQGIFESMIFLFSR